MKLIRRGSGKLAAVPDRSFAVIQPGQTFRLASDHPLCQSPCLVCRRPVGGEHLVVAGLAGFCGPACSCGGIMTAAFLAHARHLPLSDALVFTAARYALTDNHECVRAGA